MRIISYPFVLSINSCSKLASFLIITVLSPIRINVNIWSLQPLPLQPLLLPPGSSASNCLLSIICTASVALMSTSSYWQLTIRIYHVVCLTNSPTFLLRYHYHYPFFHTDSTMQCFQHAQLHQKPTKTSLFTICTVKPSLPAIQPLPSDCWNCLSEWRDTQWRNVYMWLGRWLQWGYLWQCMYMHCRQIMHYV